MKTSRIIIFILTNFQHSSFVHISVSETETSLQLQAGKKLSASTPAWGSVVLQSVKNTTVPKAKSKNYSLWLSHVF
jgi:hypothetical protein